MRQEITKNVLGIKNSNLLLEFPTGTGKSKIAIDRIKKITKNKGKILIVIPKNVLKDNWKQEFKKWWKTCKLEITYTTYISFYKHIDNKWDFIIFDEGHHLSERCRGFLKTGLKQNFVDNILILSATIKRDLKQELNKLIPDLYIYKITAKEAINSKILPDPKVYLIPLQLDNKYANETIIKNPKAKEIKKIPFNQIWQYKISKYKLLINCTQVQYYNDLCNQIEWYKKKFYTTNNPIFKNKWLFLCNQRLKWLSDKKNAILLTLSGYLKDERVLIFCNSIEQTKLFGEHCINSKNKDSEKVLEDFNNNKINMITSCNMLNEGVNLQDCRIGIYGNLNSSETIVIQRLGRLLRHKEPIIIIPYYKDTREEELVKQMLENYNPELVSTLSTLKDLKLW